MSPAHYLDIDPASATTDSPGRVHCLLECRVCLGQTVTLPLPPPPPPKDEDFGKKLKPPTMVQRINAFAPQTVHHLPHEFTALCITKPSEDRASAHVPTDDVAGMTVCGRAGDVSGQGDCDAPAQCAVWCLGSSLSSLRVYVCVCV